MSWLFGLNRQTPTSNNLPPYPPASGGNDQGNSGGNSDSDGAGVDDGKGGKSPVWANFDPTGLERAAQAARELDRSSKYKFLFILYRICYANRTRNL